MDRNIKNEAWPKIIEGCKQKKKKYQEMLYQRIAPKLFSICLRYASDKQMAEDLLHDTFLKIFQKIDRYQETGSFEAWMKKICIYHALEVLRRKQKGYVKYVEVLPNTIVKKQEAIEKLSLQEIQKIIQKLPHGYRTVFNLYVIDDFTHQEIADTLNISVSTSKTQLRKARLYLQKELLRIEK